MLHILPDIRSLCRLRWDGGAIISLTETLTLKDVLCVLTLQIARDHGGIGHARMKHSFNHEDLKHRPLYRDSIHHRIIVDAGYLPQICRCEAGQLLGCGCQGSNIKCAL